MLLLCWKPEMQALKLISKHLDSRSAYCCEFLLHEGSLHLLIGEEGPTLRSLNYSKHLTESRRGTILVPRAAFHLANPLTRFTRIVLPPDRSSGQGQDQIQFGRADAVSARQQRTALLWSSTDGSLGYVAPLEEASFRRLYFLSTKMIGGLSHAAGLHPRAFRAMESGANSAKELKSMVDANLLAKFLQLGEEEQGRLALMVGSTPKRVLAALEALGRGVP